MSDEDSNLVQHAKRELELLGEEPATIEGYLNVIRAFADMGHSGGSASVAIPVITKLLSFENLKPLTNNPREWHDHQRTLWQSTRNSRMFSDDGAMTYWDVNEAVDERTGKRPVYFTVDKDEESQVFSLGETEVILEPESMAELRTFVHKNFILWLDEGKADGRPARG